MKYVMMKVTKRVLSNGRIEYRNEHGDLHCEDGPAVIFPNGHKAWLINGEFHREDGPAIIYSDCDKEWRLNNMWLTYEEWLELIPNPILYKWREFIK